MPKVKARLSLQANRRITGMLEGAYAATLTGRSLEFNDLREYVRGDDPKDVDWKASARRAHHGGEPLVKRYVAQRRHTLVSVVSTGRSMAGNHSLTDLKRDVAVETAGIVGWLAVGQGDRVSTVHGHAGGFGQVPPGGGEAHLERCLAAAYDEVSASGPEADLAGLLRQVARTVRRRAIVLVVADDDEATTEVESGLRRLAVQHELLMVSVGDVDPVQVPAGVAPTVDLGAGGVLPEWVRGDDLLRQQIRRDRADRVDRWHRRMTELGVVHEHLDETTTALATVRRLLRRNQHARRR